jgi:hypothetical protein
MPKMLIYKRIRTLEGRSSEAERNFSPDVRGNAMPRAFALSPPPSFKVRELFGELLDVGKSLNTLDRGSLMRWTSLLRTRVEGEA